MPAKEFARYVTELARTPLPAEVLHAARRCLIDWFSATLPGGAQPPATLLVEALGDELDLGKASLYPSGRRATVRAAALINGSAAHTVEFDDIYRDALYHPGAPVVSAALAIAQAENASGEALLKGIVAGYEVSNRIGLTVNPAHYRHWHTTGTVGSFGAAAAAGLILNLDEARVVDALGNAATMAAGLQQAFRSDAMSKPLHAGRAAECGVLVGLSAKRGVTGARGMLEGEHGFGAAMSDDPDWRTVAGDLGSRYTILETTQKNHGCCGHTFAALDAVIALRNENDLSPSDVDQIRIGTYAAALEITGNPHPNTAFEAKFSLPYCAAVALKDGRVRLEAFDGTHLRDREIRDLASKVALQVDEQAEADFPRRRSATVEIRTRRGTTLQHRAATRKGDPDDPLSDAELIDKYRELAAPVIGKGSAEVLLDALQRVDVLEDVSGLGITKSARAAAEAH